MVVDKLLNLPMPLMVRLCNVVVQRKVLVQTVVCCNTLSSHVDVR